MFIRYPLKKIKCDKKPTTLQIKVPPWFHHQQGTQRTFQTIQATDFISNQSSFPDDSEFVHD